MAYWEFLLQKEGDRDWLPLETAHVEISEGRYRIIAHTSYCETSVEVRFSHLLSEPSPPRRKTFRRTDRTTETGLMVVIPYTHLTPGSWTVACLAASGETTALWEYGVQLQVLAIESGLDYWEAELETSAPVALPELTSPTTSAVARPQPPDQQASAQIDRASGSPTAVPSRAITAAPLLLDGAPLEDLPLRIQLQHQAIVAQQQAAVTLQGQVTTFSEVAGLVTDCALWLQLRDPATGQVVQRESRSLTLQSLPQRFEVSLTLPETVTTRLLVGEMSLWTVSTPPQVLAIQGFTVTLNLDALLEIVANRGEGSADSVFEAVPPDSPPAAATTAAEAPGDQAAAILSPLAARKIPFQRIYLPSTGLTLPPVIYRPIDSKREGAPSLPPLSDQLARRRSPDTAAASRPAKPLSLPPIGNPPAAPIPEPSPADAEAPDPRPVALPSLQRSPQKSQDPDPSPNPSAASPSNSAVPVFQPDFQGRFWSRLSALAHEAQRTAANLKAQMAAAGVETPRSDQVLEGAVGQSAVPPEKAMSINHEVVIYDADSELAPPVAPPAAVDGAAASPAREHDIEEDLGEIPVPELNLPEGELVAGTPLPILVRLPFYPRRLAVKVWVTDIQSRSLADRPRWLMNWTPTETGEQTARLQLQVPLGSLEAQFDAIAIDLATQRESYKTTLVRAIVPPNLPEPELPDPL